MKKVLVIAAIVAVAFVLVWAMFMPETHSWRQKLTLVVETPQGEVTGSSVIEVRASFYQGGEIMSGTEVHYELSGEAAVVEVLPGKYLFALMGDSEELFFRAAKDRFRGKTRGEWLREIPGQTEPVALTGDLIPILVTFDDITKPETVGRVDPADLAAVFGEGVRLKAVKLEITRGAVTKGRVEEVLSWWPQMRSGPLNEMSSLKLPDDSPRGWDHLTALQFWSLDRLQEMDRRPKP